MTQIFKISWLKHELLTCVGVLLMVLTLSKESSIVCEAKEFDWSELGVSLANVKHAIGAGSNASNLKILVSPQRRMSKNYEFDYTNGSQPVPASSQSDTGYVVSSSALPYLSQSVYQLTPNHTGHSSAYSALSASLANLKSRLNARGVSLTGAIGDGSNQSPSQIYATSSTYGAPVLVDPSQQSQSSQHQQPQTQQSSQPTYLSVSNQQDSQVASPYSVAPNQSSENKTIVLAIPAKINFLTGSKQTTSTQHHSAPQPTQHAQQLSVLQSGVLGASEGNVEHVGQSSNAEQQDHHQYVIVNQPQQSFSDHHSHSVAANLNPSAIAQPNQYAYSSALYQPSSSAHNGGFTMKYVPTYSQSATATQMQQPATVQKVYSVYESPATHQLGLPITTTYETQLVDQPASGTRHSGCIDTCNSSDPRWRRYTVSKYKACCSRSAQFDTTFDHPSADKVGETSTKYADEAYYSYLQRRNRARRMRRQRNRYYSARHASSATPSSYHHQDDEPTDSAGESSAPTRGRDYPYMRYYKSRSYSNLAHSSSSEPSVSSSIDSTNEPLSSGLKYSSKERSHRRGRSRDFDSIPEQTLQTQQHHASQQSSSDPADDDMVYPRESNARGSSAQASSGYGGGEHSVDLQASGRGYGSDLREEDDSYRYDEPSEFDSNNGKSEPSDYALESSTDSNDENEQDQTGASYKYSFSGHRRKNKSRRKLQNKEKLHNKKSTARKSKLNIKSEHHSTNGTDYESSQAGDDSHDSTSSHGGSSEQDDHTTSSNSSKDPSQYEATESDKDAVMAKYRASLNESAVAHLSKTTMHLKEILSILEKKAQSRGNDSFLTNQQPVTSTPLPPITTTTSYQLSSLLGNSPYSSPLSSEFFNSDLSSLKNPYKFDTSSFSSGSLGSPSFSLPSSFSHLNTETMSPLSPPYPSPYNLHTGKHMSGPSGPGQRKRRTNKSTRYNELMLQKAAHSLNTPPSMLHHKNRFIAPPYYPTLQYPYLYRGPPSSAINYPFKNHHKNPYSSLLSAPITSKLAAATSGGLYTDESRLHGLSSLDPLANLGSSLRPSSSAMRMRSKPFIFQPQVLPIYTRHTILGQPLEIKA